jgi:hypothetical protein
MSLDESRYYIMLKHDERYNRATKNEIYENSFHPYPLFWQELLLEAKYQTTERAVDGFFKLEYIYIYAGGMIGPELKGGWKSS